MTHRTRSTPCFSKKKAEFESRADRGELERKYRTQYGDQPVSPADLNTSPAPDKLDARLARLKASYEQAQKTEAPITGDQFASGSGSVSEIELTAAEIQVDQKLQGELRENYDQFVEDGARGLQSLFKTEEQMRAAVFESGILDDPESLEQAMRLLAKHGAKLRRR